MKLLSSRAHQHRHSLSAARWLPSLLLANLVALACSGCGTDDPTPPADTTAGTDASATDTATPPDSGAETSGSDTAVTDAGSDAIESTDATEPTDAVAATDAAAQTDAVTVDLKPDVFVPIEPGLYPAKCTADADCLHSCVASAKCVAGSCSFVPKLGVCLTPVPQDQVECLKLGMVSTVTPCLSCQPAPGGAQLSAATWQLALNGNGEGVSVTEVYKTGMTWNYSSKRSVSGGNALYFGDPAKYQYHNGKQVGALATFPKVTVPAAAANPRLQFWLWLQTEQTIGDDLLTVAVLPAAGDALPVKVWTSDVIGGSTQDGWQRVTLDLAAFADQQVQFQLLFETKDGILNAYEGAYIDDISVASGCCASQADCNDGNACTADLCAPGPEDLPVCSHETKSDCCSTSADCDDGVTCTLDLCPTPGGSCTHSDKPGCCTTAQDCDDKDACTVDSCPGSGGQCQHINTCCKSDGECKSADPCQKGSCVAGQCLFTETCCSADPDCDDFNPCTKDACDKGKCVFTPATVPGCCSPQVLSGKFAGSEDGFESSASVSGVVWHYKDVGTAAKSQPGVLALGDPTKEPWTVNGAMKVTATSPYVTVLQGKETTLTFQVSGTANLNSGYNLRVIALVDGESIVLTTIAGWSINNAWKSFQFDLTALGGKSFPLLFEFERTSNSGNFSGGQLYIDDVEVVSTCQAKKCSSSTACNPAPWPYNCLTGGCNDGQCTYANSCCKDSSECNDNNLCTQDACSNSKCSFKAIAGCCMGDGDCNDNNPCTTDTCTGPGGSCSFAPIVGCCTSSGQCNDNNACTTDKCAGFVCVNQNFCCTVDADCSDGETTCTTEKCVSKVCAFTPTGAAGCCTPEVWVNDFDTGDLKDLALSNSAGPDKGWQLANSPGGKSKSGTGTLYYGQSGIFNFDFGASNGQATTPDILLPTDTPSTLSFSLFMDTEGGTSYDNLVVSVVKGGVKTKVFDKTAAGFSTGSWYEVKFDLKAFQGEQIKVTFDFNTGDSIGNGGLGVVIDDLQIVTDCSQ
jgi:hypothetical protein